MSGKQLCFMWTHTEAMYAKTVRSAGVYGCQHRVCDHVATTGSNMYVNLKAPRSAHRFNHVYHRCHHSSSKRCHRLKKSVIFFFPELPSLLSAIFGFFPVGVDDTGTFPGTSPLPALRLYACMALVGKSDS